MLEKNMRRANFARFDPESITWPNGYTLLGVVFGMLAIYLFNSSAADYQTALASQAWPAAPITTSPLSVENGHTKNSGLFVIHFWPVIFYGYKAGGVFFIKRHRMYGSEFREKSEAEEAGREELKKFTTADGKPTVVYYNPKDPNESYFERPSASGALQLHHFSEWFFVLCLAVSLWKVWTPFIKRKS